MKMHSKFLVKISRYLREHTVIVFEEIFLICLSYLFKLVLMKDSCLNV